MSTWELFNCNSTVNELQSLNFTTINEFNEWRLLWKNTYKLLTNEIKCLKQFFKSLQRAVDVQTKGVRFPKKFPTINGTPVIVCREYQKTISSLTALSNTAKLMMLTLENAKRKIKKLNEQCSVDELTKDV